VGVGVAAALLLASCTSDRAADDPQADPSVAADLQAGDTTTGASTPTRSAAPVPPAPEDDACYRLRFAALAQPSNDEAPVRCGRRHLTQTIHVGRIDMVVAGHALAVDSDHAVEQVSRACARRFAARLGGSDEDRRLSRLEVVWFAPTLEQSDAGARWFRCDVVAVAARDRLHPLPPPRRLRGILDDPGRAAPYALCGTTAPGERDFARVVCARRHAWRAVATVDLPGPRRYPGERSVREAGDETCRDLVRDRAADPLSFRYGWEWPTREQWRAGQRYGFCWEPD
jgi:hypothetical protein